MDIEMHLNEIIQKYDIDEHMPFFRQSIKAKLVAENLYKSLRNVVLVGNTKTDLKWFNFNICRGMAEEILVADDNYEMLEKYDKSNICLLFVSYYDRNSTMVKLLQLGLRVIDLYDELENKGLFFSGNFYDIYQETYHDFRTGKNTRDVIFFDINALFFEHRRRFELENNLEKQQKFLEQMIFDCVYARDFLTLKKYIDLYVEKFSGEKVEKYLSFYKEIEEILQQIKLSLRERGKKDCIMIWLDALEYGEDMNMPFVNGLNNSALVLQNVYTVTPYTGQTFKTLFAKSRVVEEESYKITKISKKNSKLLAELEKRNYKFLYYGTLDLLENFHMANHLYSFYGSFTQIYWDIIRDIMNSSTDDKLFCVLHEDFQTHIPYVSMGITGDQYSYREPWPGYHADKIICDKQALESREYVDRQLEFWSKLLPDKMFKIYMSDHGHTFWGKYHCIFKVQQMSVMPQTCNSLISYYDFDKLVLQILDYAKVDDTQFQNDYVIVQDSDYYNKEFIITNIRKKNMPHMDLVGYQGVVTKEDMFILYNDGTETYHKFYNDECMVTNDRLNYLRGITSKKRIDISKEEMFKYSFLMQKIIQRCENRTKKIQEKKVSIIKKVFDDILDSDILAIRGGGIHSIRLLMLLDETSRKKISYIVDRDIECYAGKLGIKVISPEKINDYNINKIIISSFDYRYIWIEECKSNSQIQVIDLYDLFEREGIMCQKEFYKLEFAECDFAGIDVEI